MLLRNICFVLSAVTGSLEFDGVSSDCSTFNAPLFYKPRYFSGSVFLTIGEGLFHINTFCCLS
jgi:hypothetical protein